jgi:phosphoribosylaminoimidazole-succinocarboxamide synthase
MLTQQELANALSQALAGVDLPFLGTKQSGKVRDLYQHDDTLVLITSDRLSAFDRVLGLVPYKGQVLTQLAAFWFAQTQSIIDNHLLDLPDPNVTIVRRCQMLPVEVVVRGYITGVTKTSIWYRYSQGDRMIYGIEFADGLRKNDPLPQAVITPTTKAGSGRHDEIITSQDVVAGGLATPKAWAQICEAALAIFQRGQEIARRAGLILVDTKYEFGLTSNGQVMLIDEVHTPDSSRYWRADSYAERHAAGLEPENYDKEMVRLYYAQHGYRGDGDPMPLPADLAVGLAQRYIDVYERLCRQPFLPGELPAAARIERNLRRWYEIRR